MTDLNERMRVHLTRVAALGVPITYQALARDLGLIPPQTIRQVTDALEVLMAEDVAAARPMIAALVISKSGSGLPAAGFFEMAARLGRFDVDLVDAHDYDAQDAFWRAEFAAVLAWANDPA